MTQGSETDWDAVVEAGRLMDEAAIPDENIIYINGGIVITERLDDFVVYTTPLDPTYWGPQL